MKKAIDQVRIKRSSLVYAPYYMSLGVITTMSLILGTFWAVTEYLHYRDDIAEMRVELLADYKMRLADEHRNIVEFIQYKRSQANSRAEEELRRQVQMAYITAAHLYSLYRHDKTEQELKTMVVETLRPVRWNSGTGYYFAIGAKSGLFELVADRPQLEHQQFGDFVDADGKTIFSDMARIIREQGAGFYRYRWTKPERLEATHQKVSFIRYFGPFDWIIGAGLYIDDIEERIQHDVLERVREITFADRGDVLIFSSDGTTICDYSTNREGRSIRSLIAHDNYTAGLELLKLSVSRPEGGYLNYQLRDESTGSLVPMLHYVKSYPDWGWHVSTSISLAALESTIATEAMKRKREVKNQFVTYLLMTLITMLGMYIVTFLHSRRIRRGILIFTRFFREAAEARVKLDENRFVFSEFKTIGEFANKMVEARIGNEQKLTRNKLRLDTLLDIGLKQAGSFEEICDFVLGRMLVITASEQGYICCLDERETHVLFHTFARSGMAATHTIERKYPVEITKFKDIETTVVLRQAWFRSGEEDNSPPGKYPPQAMRITRAVDVPIFSDRKISLVAGVSNRIEPYEENDAREITLLLEGMLRQITINRAGKEMARLKNMLNSINDSMPSMLVGVNRHMRIILWNKEAEQVTGAARDRVLGRPVDEILPRLQELEGKIRAAVDDQQSIEERRISHRQNGVIRYESITIFPFPTEDDIGAVIRIDDITEKIHLEDMMVQSEKMLSIGGLAAGLAHEINNPLAGIMQNLQVVRNRLAGDLKKNTEAAARVGIDLDRLGRYLEERGVSAMFDTIHDSAQRAAVLVRNMLSFSRKTDFVTTTQDTVSLVEKTLELAASDYDLKNRFDFRKITLVRKYHPEPLTIVCETTNIQQVLLNIFKNSAQALADRASGQRDDPRIIIRVYPEDEMVCIEIEDNGPGMNRETKKRIFEPFFTTKPVGVGTGLGLSISYFIVTEQHHGSLTVESEPGAGACFTIKLPQDRHSSSA